MADNVFFHFLKSALAASDIMRWTGTDVEAVKNKLVQQFDGGSVGSSSYNTGALDFTPGLVLVLARTTGTLHIGWARDATASNQAATALTSTGLTSTFAHAALYQGKSGPTYFDITVFSKASGVTLARTSGTDTLTNITLIVFEA